MKVLFDNVDFGSTSGPNSFAYKLANQLIKMGHAVVSHGEKPDVQLSFITSTRRSEKTPVVLRLDGIYFNTKQDWRSLNSPIKASYDAADSVVFQTEFNKKLIETFFGVHKSSCVIKNGTAVDVIAKIPQLNSKQLDSYEEVWCCASSWRPHKRLQENIRYFLETAPENSCFVIAGNNPDVIVNNPRVFYVGNLSWEQCISLYKRSTTFVHLSFLDHCPNVVLDARASGCDIVVASSGGTKEIAGLDATVIVEDEWDFSPIDLYDPPHMNFNKTIINDIVNDIDIASVANEYVKVFKNICQN